MRLLIIILLTAPIVIMAQKKAINTLPLNELELNISVNEFGPELFLITGYEELYENHENLRANILKNIELGIQEGIYEGGQYREINGLRSSRMALFFFEGELYKIRWFFLPIDYRDLDGIVENINTFLIKSYGPEDEGFLTLKSWASKRRHLQSFYDEGIEFQIEYRDEKIHQKVEKLKPE